MKYLLLAALALSAPIVVASTGLVYPHDAPPSRMQPLGWSYGWDCCSATDCSQMQQGEIEEGPNGYVVKRTGEVIPYNDKRIRQSKDEFFHRCAPGANFDAPKSLCLYTPGRGY